MPGEGQTPLYIDFQSCSLFSIFASALSLLALVYYIFLKESLSFWWGYDLGKRKMHVIQFLSSIVSGMVGFEELC